MERKRRKTEHLVDRHEEEQEGEQSQSDVHEGTLIDSADGEMEPEETNGDMSPTGDQPGLQAFPDFEQDNEEAAKPVSKMMGVPEWLARPTTVDQSESLPVAEAATQFQLSERCIKACGKLGIERFFAVQVAAFPILLQSRSLSDPHLVPRDICVSAPTGSGKTISYVIPVTEALAKRTVVRLRALVILPTRDLVMQVKETFDAFVRGTDLKVATATGQQSFAHEQAQLVGDPVDGLAGGQSRVDILICTPGRLIDHLNGTRAFTLQHLRFLIIDEADRLLNQSFQDWLGVILKSVNPPKKSDPFALDHGIKDHDIPSHDAASRNFLPSLFDYPKTDIDLKTKSQLQKLLFSATLTKNPAKIASLHLQNPQYISVVSVDTAKTTDAVDETVKTKYALPSTLKEYYVVCETEQKPLHLIHLLRTKTITSALCFTRSVESTRRLNLLLQLFNERWEREHVHQKGTVTQPSSRIEAAEYSSDLSQSQRKSILSQFKRGKLNLLICSDLVARGIDLESVGTVISYDVPLFMKKYVHRVGRTARAGRAGEAYTLVEPQEARHFKEMHRDAGHWDKVKKMNISSEQLEDLMDTYEDSLIALQNEFIKSKPSTASYQQKLHRE